MTVAALNWRFIDIITAILTAIIVTYTISKIVDLIFTQAFKKIIKNDSLWKKLLPLIHNVIIIAIWILWFLTTVNILWFNINTLLTWAWIGWVILALASKEAASNVFGSLSLVFSKSFKTWDLIRIKLLEWTVEEITLSYTKLIDKKWNYIYIPNKNVISENLENLSHWKFKKQEISIPLPINIPAKDISKLLKSFEAYWDKSKKDEKFDDYKILFDWFSSNSQNIIFSFQTDFKTDLINLKREVYLDLKDLLDKEKIIFTKD